MSSTISAWVDVQILSTLDAGEVIGLLDDPNVQGGWQDGETIHLYWPSHIWSPDHRAKLRQILRQLDSTSVPAIHVQTLPNHDWNQQWAKSVKPLQIGKRLIVRPSWETAAAQPGQIEIILDPKQAFGTGHHATTRMLLEWLEEDIRGGETLLDVGTGSGLLAMAALRFGASHAVGIDNDPVAIDCAREYAAQNCFGTELSLICGELGEWGHGRTFELVLANLDRQTLLQLAERLAGYVQGKLLVSGLLRDQREEIVAAFAAVGLYPGRLREQDGWIAMEFLRVQSCEEVS